MSTTPAPRLTRGFSLIEVLVALALLFVIAMMLMPLFSRSMELNFAGREYGMAANFIRAGQEELTQADFNGPRLDVTAGTEALDDSFWAMRAAEISAPGDDVQQTFGEWLSSAQLGTADPLWQRETRVRQFSVEDVQADYQLDNPLPAGTDPQFVHLKEIRMEVQTVRDGGPLGASRKLVVSRIRAF